MADDMRREFTERAIREQCNALHARIREERKRKGLTQTSIGERIGKAQKTVSRYEQPSHTGTQVLNTVRLCEGIGIRLYPIDVERLV